MKNLYLTKTQRHEGENIIILKAYFLVTLWLCVKNVLYVGKCRNGGSFRYILLCDLCG